MRINSMKKLSSLVRGYQRYCHSSPRVIQGHTTKIIGRRASSVAVESVKSTVRMWRLFVPAGVGFSAALVTQWRYLHQHGYPVDVADDKPELLNDFMVTCYCCLPLRITSRIGGWLTSINLPVGLRPTIYRVFANMFNVNQDEIELDLSTFPSLVEFFVRALKNNARPIAQNTNMTAPADGEVLYFGPVTSCRVEQVKGVTYDLKYFLGDLSSLSVDQMVHKTEQKDDFVNALLKNPDNRLYQLIVYLAPGDYHRFHSPTDWNIKFRRHFPGKLLSVNPTVLKYMPNLFSLNERVVYLGEWAGGFMAYAAIGATNVGSIKVYRDQELATNKVRWTDTAYRKDLSFDNVRMAKGELFGEFRLGSTIVLLFEAPPDFQFCLQTGQPIKVGQALSVCPDREADDQRRTKQHLIIDVAHKWKDIGKIGA
ncbi:phosphatidylserine decarboxylase proenzyme, mitochondrial [Harpegnathos saltator]|uniref:phosphatidylserine decarboxylase proenzyme, mitochondrial n=1 Tax=Harpegnathos saltator TaxID=610380 RepID=UPI00058D70C7|nr:phosphatidylserine decarboxylase proenzyme, mitochondrial [Harpegnathos saltator]